MYLHDLSISEEALKQIEKGGKRVDARPITGIYAPITVGDRIRYNQKLIVPVAKINTYGSMWELVQQDDWKLIVPDAQSPEEAYEKIRQELEPGQERLPAKAIYFDSMDGHWFRYWFRKAGKHQV